MSGKPAAFLDRDGLINALVADEGAGAPESPLDPADVAILPGVPEALRVLDSGGLTIVVASNQPAAAKGTATAAQLDAVHARVVKLLGDDAATIAEWRYCRHHPQSEDPTLRGCECRKPAPGLLIEAAGDLGLNLGASWMIGDADRDVEAGIAAGCRTILVEYGPSAHRRAGRVEPNMTAWDLRTAASAILEAPR